MKRPDPHPLRNETRRKRDQRKRKAERQKALIAELESENHRLRLLASAALERTQVGDADEATAILEQVIKLDGSYVPRDVVIGTTVAEIPPEGLHFVGHPWAPADSLHCIGLQDNRVTECELPLGGVRATDLQGFSDAAAHERVCGSCRSALDV